MGDLIKSGKLETEITTHGVFVDVCMRALWAGRHLQPDRFRYTRATGKEIRVIDGKEYIFEKPISLTWD